MNNKYIRQYNNKKQRHGYWEVYYRDGNLFYKGFFHNGKDIGYSEYYPYAINNLNKLFHII